MRRLELERLEKERIEEEKRKKRGRGIVKKKNKKEEEEALRLAEEKKKLEEERKKEVPFLDPDNLEEILENLKVCLEKMAKLVILLVSYDKPLGKYSQIHSVKFFEEFLQNVKIYKHIVKKLKSCKITCLENRKQQYFIF